jgi:hypothetical protein
MPPPSGTKTTDRGKITRVANLGDTASCERHAASRARLVRLAYVLVRVCAQPGELELCAEENTRAQDGPLDADFWYRDGMTDATVGLADAIAALREELLAVMGEGQEASMRFRVAPIEMSLQVVVTKEGEGKIGWKVLELGGSYSAAVTQTLRLRLDPVWRQDDGSYASDFTVADQAAHLPRFGPRPREPHL